jgi:CHASE1-domain containing sensor protein
METPGWFRQNRDWISLVIAIVFVAITVTVSMIARHLQNKEAQRSGANRSDD